MTEKEILEGNRLISEFDGYKSTVRLHPFDPSKGDTIKHPDLAGVTWNEALIYHISWEKIMPVVEKIESLPLLDANVTISKSMVMISANGNYNGEIIFHGNIINDPSKINTIWQAVVQFIKWHNKNKTA